MMSWGNLVALADLLGAPDTALETITPMRFATVIRLDAGGTRETARMRWGFVPRWERDPVKGSKFIHARAESLDEKRAFAEAFARRRGLLVVHTFNEGKELSPRKTEQYVVTPRDGLPLAIAVVWEHFGEAHAGSLETFAMVTVPANRLISTITDRMPAVVAPEDWAKWLGEVPAHAEELKALLRPFEGAWDMAPEKGTPSPKTRPESTPELF